MKGILEKPDSVIDRKPVRRDQTMDLRCRVLLEIAGESEHWIVRWARTVVGGESKVAVARKMGYKEGSAITHNNRRLEQQATQNPALAARLVHIL